MQYTENKDGVQLPTINLFHRAVISELMKQDDKWGRQVHTPDYWLGILGEEFGEISKATIERNREEAAHECVQLAACAFRLWRAMVGEPPEHWVEIPWPGVEENDDVDG